MGVSCVLYFANKESGEDDQEAAPIKIKHLILKWGLYKLQFYYVPCLTLSIQMQSFVCSHPLPGQKPFPLSLVPFPFSLVLYLLLSLSLIPALHPSEANKSSLC